MDKIDEDSIAMSFDSMTLENKQSSYSHNSLSYGSQMGYSS